MLENESTELIPRATVESIVMLRNVALAKYNTAYAALSVAAESIQEAQQAGAAASPGINSYNWHSDQSRQDFLFNLEVAKQEDFIASARRLTDIDVWSHIVRMTDLESIMDKEGKDELRDSLQTDPPEVTVENVYATLQQFSFDYNLIWKRGLANCFSKLDRRFRSHSGWKVGNRIILNKAMSDWGYFSNRLNHRDTLIDVERAFFVLDGRTPPKVYTGIVQVVEESRRKGYGARQSEVETEFFKVNVYINGNIHIWFKRKDLVEKANKLLAEYYGEVIPDARTPEEDSADVEPKTTLAKNYGHFPTPYAVAEQVIEVAELRRRRSDASLLTVLEPSAGAGNLARRAVEQGCTVDCIEIQAPLARSLEMSGLYHCVFQEDFMRVRAHQSFDRVIMNPPFDLERDIDHVLHAMEFLKPDGCLLAVMSAGTEFRETKKSRAFRDRMKVLHARWRDLPAGSFAEVGTNVNTLMIRVWKDGRTQSYW